MTKQEAKVLQQVWERRYGDVLCLHSRVVDDITTTDDRKSGNLLCRECGTVVKWSTKQTRRLSNLRIVT